ncbi:MAG: hypothetical protein FJZ01_23805 [Candidatus Sericytochromatia bacterium]|nr:hypothetical protein [Candidatus Tanganyikabacteria bacterium]
MMNRYATAAAAGFLLAAGCVNLLLVDGQGRPGVARPTGSLPASGGPPGAATGSTSADMATASATPAPAASASATPSPEPTASASRPPQPTPLTFKGEVKLLAGNGTQTVKDGKGAAAGFNAPRAVAIDETGDLWVLDGTDLGTTFWIRRVTPEGDVTTIDATKSTMLPYGIFAARGRLYTMMDERLWMREASGSWSVLAGAGGNGFSNGDPKTAKFSRPLGLVVDSAGNVLVADLGNRRIRKVTPAGQVSTFAGSGAAGREDGPAASATLLPGALALAPDGALYFRDYQGGSVRMVTPGGEVKTLKTGVVTGEFWAGLARDAAGTLYHSDGGPWSEPNHNVKKIDLQGNVTSLAGSGPYGYKDGTFAEARFYGIAGLAIDPVRGRLYTVEHSNFRVRFLE